jgi:hypothetical protein
MAAAPRGNMSLRTTSHQQSLLERLACTDTTSAPLRLLPTTRLQVGGMVDEVTEPSAPKVPRWECFIGDRPMAPTLDAAGRRRCIAQIAEIEDLADSGQVVGSREILELLAVREWEWHAGFHLCARLRCCWNAMPCHAMQCNAMQCLVGSSLT